MLCTLKVRRSPAAAEDVLPYRLKILSKQAVGGAGGLISDEAGYTSLPELLQAMSDLQLPGDLLRTSNAMAGLEDAEDRWLVVATDMQITFEVLGAAGFSLDSDSD